MYNVIKNIICGKFDNCIDMNIPNIKKTRIGSINPNKLTKNKYIPISTNGRMVKFEDKIYSIDDLFRFLHINNINDLIVLTGYEKNLILEKSIDFDIKIHVFEFIYPIFNEIRYISNIEKNYSKLLEVIKIIDNLGIKGKTLGNNLSTNNLFKIERKLRFKNNLDYFFTFSYKGGYQEVFKLKEERSDRIVIAFDFNSMYASNMDGYFLEPRYIKYINLRGKNINIENLKNGMYRVILKRPKDTFFLKFHPFKYVRLRSSFYFNLEKEQCIEILIFKNEIEYYGSFFESIDIIEGFYSNKKIKHPLYEYAKSMYIDRTQYTINYMKSLCKFKLVTIHGSTNMKNYINLYFKTKSEMIDYVSSKFMIQFPEDMSEDYKLSLICDSNIFSFQKKNNTYKAKIINYNSHSVIYSLSSQIIANSRIKMLKTIELFLKHESVEICYCNIDSLHISIKKDEVDSFLQHNSNLISNKLGCLKIESISNKGYWFDIGRYWLLGDNGVDIFKNVYFNRKGNKTPFIKDAKVKYIYKSESFSYVKSIYISLYNSFSYSKKVNVDNKNIDNIDFFRYNHHEINELDVAKQSYTKEILSSKKLKIDLYNKLSTVK